MVQNYDIFPNLPRKERKKRLRTCTFFIFCAKSCGFVQNYIDFHTFLCTWNTSSLSTTGSTSKKVAANIRGNLF